MPNKKQKKWSDFDTMPIDEVKNDEVFELSDEELDEMSLEDKEIYEDENEGVDEFEALEETEDEEVDEEVEDEEVIVEDSSTKRPIKQLAINNQLIRTYTSIEEASKHTGIEQVCIEDACEGVDRYIFAGFKWMYI